MATMDNRSNGGINSDQHLVRINGSIGGLDDYKQITCKEVTATESLLTPGLQTSATFQSQIYLNEPFKNWDDAKNKDLKLDLYDDTGKRLIIEQKIYRLDNREFNPVNIGQIEEMTFHACDKSLLKDAKTLVSKSWNCTTPDQIVKYVLSTCIGATNAEVDKTSPARDYVAEMIHPFQVIAQQANVALADGDDPSFVHYMTYRNKGMHHFKALKTLVQGSPKAVYVHSEAGVRRNVGYNQIQSGLQTAMPYLAPTIPCIHFMFPCDFDLLSDLLNGLDENGKNINSMSTFNVGDASGSYLNGNMNGCVVNGNFKQSLTNKGTAQQQNGCETDVEKHLLRRQARMGLLEKDKVALRLIAPWNPDLHAGDVIRFEWFDKDGSNCTLLYGSGNYLISSLTHRVQMGGYSTTTLDCVSTTTGQGIV